MKKNLKFLLLFPLLMAVLCESDDLDCAVIEPPAYNVQIENMAPSYTIDEKIWLNAKVSSKLLDGCSANEDPEINLNAALFMEGMFILKLNSALTDLNAEITEDFNVVYDIGEAFVGEYCLDAIEYIPELTDDQLNYQFRIGLSMTSPGDYCIFNVRNSFFDVDEQNNDQIFEPYNTFNNAVKFNYCSDINAFAEADAFYFFSVE